MFALYNFTQNTIKEFAHSSFAISDVYIVRVDNKPPLTTPPTSLPITKYSNVFPKYTNNQNPTLGNASQRVDCLQPQNDVTALNAEFPIMAPIDPLDASHDICSLFSGPVVNGVFSDIKIGITGVIHDWIEPSMKFNTLPIICQTR